MFNQIQFGKRIQQLRKDKGLTQKEAAEHLHISTTHLSKMEVGIGAPSIDLCIEIAIFYDVSLDYLITGLLKKHTPKQLVREAIELLSEAEQRLG